MNLIAAHRACPRLLQTLLLASFLLGTGRAAPNGGGGVPTVDFAVATQVAGEGAGTIQARITLSAVQGTDVIVPFLTSGTATDPADYSVSANPVVILAGNSYADLVILLVDDTLYEPQETIELTLHTPTGAALGTSIIHTVTLVDNDGPRGQRRIRSLELSPWGHHYSVQRLGDPAQVLSATVTNTQAIPITFEGLTLEGASAADFQVTYGDTLPLLLVPGQSTSLTIDFLPLDKGSSQVSAIINQKPRPRPPGSVTLQGVAIGLPAAEVLLACSPTDYLDMGGERWCEDYGATGSSSFTTSSDPIGGTQDEDLYRTAREGASFGYSLPLPDGEYDVIVHAAELSANSVGERVFDVTLQGVPSLTAIDLIALVGKEFAWQSAPQRVTVAGGRLVVGLTASAGEALIAGLEVRSVPVITGDAALLDFGAVDKGNLEQRVLTVTNSGLAPGKVLSLSLILDGSSTGSGEDFYVSMDGVDYYGADSTVQYSVDWDLAAGQSRPLSIFFQPTEHDDHYLRLELAGVFGMVSVDLKATGTDNGWGYLEPVLAMDKPLFIDFDGDGSETVGLIGSASHTHESGKNIVAYEWRVDGGIVSTSADTTQSVTVGAHPVDLTIWDDNVPANQATDSKTLDVYPLGSVVGILAAYYDGTAGGAGALLDAVPAAAQFVERRTDYDVNVVTGTIGGSGMATEVMVQATADFVLANAAQVQIVPSGGYDTRVYLSGALITGTVALGPGSHALDVRWAVADVSELPLDLDVFIDGIKDPNFETGLTHDETAVLPIIHGMTDDGTDQGGNLITIVGFGFFPEDQVTVHWGTLANFTKVDFTSWSDEKIELISPPGAGQITVTVETPVGTSNGEVFTYTPSGPVPIDFVPLTDRYTSLASPTCATFHANGKLYVGLLDGRIAELSFDEDWYLQSPGVVLYPGVSGLTNFDVCGITTNPYDDPAGPVKIYVGHGEHWANGGGSFTGPSPFSGQVSVLTGPNFDTPVAVVDGLPVSNHDHGINGLTFDNNGDLLICVGGNTNAGVKYPALGDLDESPLSGAIVKAWTSRQNFNGNVTYVDRTTGTPVTDQVFGENCDVAAGVDVESYGHGLRNGFDLVLTTSGSLYASDNGPDWGYGFASTGASTDTGSHAFSPDELVWIEEDGYYGHPNRSRGFADPRQDIYQDLTVPTASGFTQQMLQAVSSSDGLDEYRSTTFGNQLRGWLVLQRLVSAQLLVELDSRGQSVLSSQWVTPTTPALGVVTGHGGALVAIGFTDSAVKILLPNDAAVTGLTAYEITPWRAPSTGGTSFVIGGEGFISGQTTVTIAGVPATVNSVTPKRIYGTLPPLPENNIGALHDVIVRVGLDASLIPGAFLSLPAQPGSMPGHWRSETAAPVSLGEVTCAVVGTELFLMGQGSAQTQVFDLVGGSWLASRAVRPFPGNHHACEVWGGKILLFGGLDSGAPGQVQIYDVATDIWTIGTPMPWNGGGCSSSLIGGLVYVCGGIVGSSTVANLSVYDPATDTWDPGGGTLPPMPTPVNHAASATDGGLLWVFGGRDQGNWPQAGFTVVQIFDPVAGTWSSSSDVGSPLVPMPLGRGGTGRAVFHHGEFYVMGGEDSTDVFGEVQVYDPVQNTWRQDAPLPTPRHGIFPTVFKSRILVVGGGTMAGFSSSSLFEVFRRN